jgi:hypothetical protein
MEIYKGYGIKQYGDAFFIMLNGERINTVRGTLFCAKHCIDSDYEDMTVVSQNLIENKQDLYLDPDFTVEENDFVFKAHDDDKKDYIVRVTFDDLAACLEVPSEDITKISISNTDNQQIVEACQTIVDRYQTGTTSYDVEIKRTNVLHTVWVNSEEYQIQTGDLLVSDKKRPMYTQIRKGRKLDVIPFSVVSDWNKHLKQTNPYPLTFEVI